MSPALLKMWIALASMGLMFIALLFIFLSRFKLKGVFSKITATIAYICMALAGVIVFLVVMSGPTAD